MEYVTTDYDGCIYITAGKRYDLNRCEGDHNGQIIDDEGDTLTVLIGNKCGHLNYKSWTLHTTTELKLEVGKTYVLNNGEKHVCRSGKNHPLTMGHCWYNEDGRCGTYDADAPCSVSHEYTQPEGKTLAELDVKAGDVVECVSGGISCDVGVEYTVSSDMRVNDCNLSDFDVSLFRIVSRASDTPTLWRDMTDAEKGALLLAKHEGKRIEYMTTSADWVVSDGLFFGHRAYRIKPTPKVVETSFKWWVEQDITGLQTSKTYEISLDMIDGNPDTTSIRMDEL